MVQRDVSILIEKVSVISSGYTEEKDVWITGERFSEPFSTINTRIDGHSLRLTPGLIDLQINGFAGSEFSQGLKGLKAAVFQLPQHGITSFLPTIPTGPLTLYREDFLKSSLSYAQTCIGAQPLGWHLEGPFINVEMSGIHPKHHILEKLDVDFWDHLFDSNTISIMTLAPESPCALALLALLQDHEITLAIGHSNPSEKDLQVFYDSGGRLVTHLFNAMPPFHHRKGNLLASVLGTNLFKATIIADLMHVSKEALQIAYKCCQDRLAIVSDGCPLLGTFQKNGRFLGSEIEIRGDTCYIQGTNSLAGSSLFLNEQLLRAVEVLNIPFERALEMVTSIPAAYLGLEDSKGIIAVGFDADCVFWEGNKIVATISKGRLVYAQDRFLQRVRG